jgi:lipopolysaccharide heptosyltransferase II
VTPSPGWSDARNVLCIRLDTLGDVVMTSPALRAIKRSSPNARVTLLTSSRGAAAARLVPHVDRVAIYDAPWLKATATRPDGAADRDLIARLRSDAFDAAIIFTVFSQNPLPAALTCYLADIPRRLAHCRENPYQLLTDWVKDPEPEQGIRHEVLRQLDLVAAVGFETDDDRLEVALPDAARVDARAALEQAGVDLARPWAVVHPGASAPSRRYPPEHLATACRALARDSGWTIAFTGDRSEIELVNWIRREMGAPSHSLAGRLDVAALAAVLELAPVLISNNTGPVHLAAAVGTPVVDLYALTNPQHTPWRVPHEVLSHDVPCKWCFKSICPEGHHNCLRLVDPDDVVRAAIGLARGARGRTQALAAP